MENDQLSWQYTSSERRNLNKKVLIAVFLPAVALYVILSIVNIVADFPVRGTRAFQGIIPTLIVLLIGYAFAFFYNRFIPYKTREYALGSDGITIKTGERTKKYDWNQLNYFFEYTTVAKPDPEKFMTTNYPGMQESVALESQVYKAIQRKGKVFLLKKKGGILRKVCVVLRTEPGNAAEVEKFLARHIPEKPSRAWLG